MNHFRLLLGLFFICINLGFSWGEYNRANFCERLRLSVVNFVGDDFDVYNKLLFEHSVFIYKKLCLHQNVSPQSFLMEEILQDEEYDTTPWGALDPGDPAAILSRDRNLWMQQQEREGNHWFDKEL